ncbi:MAG: shikimate dehydrogenase [Gemmatimonas sp.]|nr:shikimate dehydrogenase [Gemmatimonas sp.]
MTPTTSPATRLVALLGDPVSHSLSPSFQNAAFAAAGVDGVYVALRCSATDLPGALIGIGRAGGAGNITVPHKQLAARVVERKTSAVHRTDACNTYWLEDGELWGDNTDVVGFRRAAERLLGHALTSSRVLLLGAGGAARAVVCALVEDSAAEVVVVNRSADRAADLVRRFADATSRLRTAPDLATLSTESFDLIVNATSLGLRPDDPLPSDPDSTPRTAAVLDLVYSPVGTPWIRSFEARGIPAADGLDMLLFQGAASFERWWGCPAPLAAMRAALPPR